MREDDILRQRKEAIAQLRSTLSAHDVYVAERMAHINAQHIEMPRDKTVAKHVLALKQTLMGVEHDDAKDNKILFILGESNSGKSTLITHLLRRDPSFRSYVDSDGVETRPMLFVKMPSPCTLRNLAVRLLTTLGYPVKGDIPESRAYGILQEQLLIHKVLFVVLDEAQRALKMHNPAELQKVSDTLIELVDATDWPVRLILIGVSPLETLRKRDKQMKSRSIPMPLSAVPKSQAGKVVKWVNEIVTVHAGLRIGKLPVDDFARRLVHACEGNSGSIILLIRAAIKCALGAGRDTIRAQDFATAYHEVTGCPKSENLFETMEWENVAVGQAKVAADEDDDLIDIDDVPLLKPLKSGERPR